MLNNIISFSIRNKLIIGLLTLALVGYGFYQFTKLPIDAVPDITDNQVQVITTAPALGAPDIERLITFPIEQACSNIPGLHEIRSFSRFGLSLITIVFNDDVDIYWARQQVSERLKTAEEQIPKGLGTPSLAPVTTGLGEIYQYVLKPGHGYESKYGATELRTIQDWIVRRQLLGVKGVADVSSFGGRVKQYEIAVNPSTLKANNITISDVFAAVEKNNENTGGAYIEKASTVLYIRAEGLVKRIEDVQQIVVRNLANGTPLLIKDVAEVRVGNAIRYGAMTYNDEGEVAGAVVMMLKGDNSNRVIADVKARIEQIRKTLPEGVELEPFLDRTKMVNAAIRTVSTNLMEGALIVIFILVLFLGNLRAGILVASVIPLSMLFAVIMMNMFGVSGNLMSLGALDFGLIVDGAVIIVEAVMHHLVHRHRHAGQPQMTQLEMDESVNRSASRMMNSAVFGQIIILIVYLPIFTLEGIEGKMFRPMAQTVAFALLGAFLLSLTYVPMMSALFLNRQYAGGKNFSDRMMDFFTRHHLRYFKKALDYPKTVIAASIGLLVLSIFVFTRMGGEFIPELPEGDFAVETRVLTGSNINVSSQVVMQSAHVLLSRFPEVEKVVGKTGSGEIPTDPMPMEVTDMMVILKEKDQWTSAHSWDELSAKMNEALGQIPGVTYSFQFPVAMRFNELMTGAKQDVVCKIFGENLDTLSKYAKVLGNTAAGVKGVKNIYVEQITGLPQLIINYNRHAIAQFGLNIRDINNVVNTAFAGQASGMVFEDEKRFDLVVRLAGEQRQRVEDVQNLLIPTPDGSQVPLYQLADVSIRESVNQIQRDDAKRRIIVGFNVGDRDVQSIVNDLQERVGDKIKLPSGYYITYGGAFENLEAARQRLMLAVPLSLLLIFLFLYFAFGSVRQGLLIYSAIPLSAIGGIFFLAFRGMPFSISAGVGFIALFGVAVLNGIVLLAEFNRIRNDGETDLKQIVLRGTKQRLRPVLMTAFVASLGFLPMAISHNAGAEVQRPLATVVIGGLLMATFLTLFVLPMLYILFEKMNIRRPSRRNRGRMLSVAGLLMLIAQTGKAQQEITLPRAIQLAMEHNLQVRHEKLIALYHQKMQATAVDLPQATITGQWGQFNSVYTDNAFGISQSVSLPSVYKGRKVLQQEIYDGSILHVALQEAELRKQVSEVFYQIVYLDMKRRIIQQADSMYALFADKANLRFQKGESGILEKTLAETQRGQLTMQLNALLTDRDILQLKFQLLLNTPDTYQPVLQEPKLVFASMPDTTSISQHPQLLYLQQQQQISVANTRIQRQALLPALYLGFNSVTIQGNGADNMVYDRSRRFNAIQFGVSVPFFHGAQKARIDVANVEQMIAGHNLHAGKQSLATDYDIAMKHYRNKLQSVAYFEQQALKSAGQLTDAANQQYASGEINYLEWTMIINNATAIRSNYADALNEVNQAVIQLNYLTEK